MRYYIKRFLDVLPAMLSVVFYKLVYGFGSVKGPVVAFGGRVNFNIRAGGRLEYGKITSRGSVDVFCDGGRVTIEDGVFLNNGCSLNAMRRISIGRDTIFGEGVKIYDHDHVIQPDGSIGKHEFKILPVTIGAGCWIGSNVVILKGVSICDQVVVGAGAVVSRSITEPGVFVVKNGALTKIR